MVHESSEAGFTVLEAIVAFAVLSLALGAMYDVIGAAHRASAVAAQRRELIEIGQSELDLARATISSVSSAEFLARTGTLSSGAKWRVIVEPVPKFAAAKTQAPIVQWVIFEAVGPNGDRLLRLRTMRTVVSE